MKMYELHKGDRVRIGNEEFVFVKTDGAYCALTRRCGDTVFVWASTEVVRKGEVYVVEEKDSKKDGAKCANISWEHAEK